MSKQGRLSPLGAATAHLQLGRFAQARPVVSLRGKVPAGAMPVLKLADIAGGRGVSATPMSGARRAANYRHQRAGAPGKFCAQLTARQAKRLRKKANQHSDRVGQYETAARDYLAHRAGRIQRGYAG